MNNEKMVWAKEKSQDLNLTDSSFFLQSVDDGRGNGIANRTTDIHQSLLFSN